MWLGHFEIRIQTIFVHLFSNMSESQESQSRSVETIPRASSWSAKVLDLDWKGKPILHHVCLAAYEQRVFDKKVGTMKDLLDKAAAVIETKILVHVVLTMRVDKRNVERRSAPLSGTQLQLIINAEIAKVIVADVESRTLTGEGGNLDPRANVYAEHERVVRQLAAMKAQCGSSKGKKKHDEEVQHQTMAGLARNLIHRTAQQIAAQPDDHETVSGQLEGDDEDEGGSDYSAKLTNPSDGDEDGKKVTLARGFQGLFEKLHFTPW